METVLIAGIDSVVGANLAAAYSKRFHVVGLSFTVPVAITGCQTDVCRVESLEAARRWIATVRPDWTIHCGPAAHSSWQEERPALVAGELAATGRAWARATREAGSRLTAISSDAVFTGPWMFHREEAVSECSSPEAQAIREYERGIHSENPQSLVVRTNAFGWSPCVNGPGWIENLLRGLEMAASKPVDHIRHATPILATDLAELILQAHETDAKGLLHLAGSERVNPSQFVVQLASEFGLPMPRVIPKSPIVARPLGFACGESSLHTSLARKTLGLPMPSLVEGLRQLHDQMHDGHRDQLRSHAGLVRERAA